MSGGIAYVLDTAHTFLTKVNKEMVELGKVTSPQEIASLPSLIEDHPHYTGSEAANRHHLLPLSLPELSPNSEKTIGPISHHLTIRSWQQN